LTSDADVSDDIYLSTNRRLLVLSSPYNFFPASFFHFHFLACHRHALSLWNIGPRGGEKSEARIVSECSAAQRFTHMAGHKEF
jgi:hypothetical protein